MTHRPAIFCLFVPANLWYSLTNFAVTFTGRLDDNIRTNFNFVLLSETTFIHGPAVIVVTLLVIPWEQIVLNTLVNMKQRKLKLDHTNVVYNWSIWMQLSNPNLKLTLHYLEFHLQFDLKITQILLNVLNGSQVKV